MFVHKPRASTARSTEISIQDIAKSAFWGAVIVALIGGLLGLLVGLGVLPHPYLEPGNVPREPLFIVMSVLWGIIPGVLIGTMLGAASRLLRSREKSEVTASQIVKSGVLVTALVDGSQREAQARRVMEEHGAVEIGIPSEKWDLDAWSSPNEMSPSLRNLSNTR